MVWDEHGNLVDMHYNLEQAKKKLEQLEAFCTDQNIDPKKCLVVGDSEDDIDIFAYTGNGVLVGKNASEALASQAWMQVAKLSDIKGLVGESVG